MSTPVEIVLIVAAVGYILIRRLAGDVAEAKRMLLLPAILAVIGLSDVDDSVKSATAVVFLVVTLAVSVLFGVLRGVSIRLYRQDGVAHMRYTWLTIVLWALNVAAKVGANLLLGLITGVPSGGNSVMLTIGVGMLVEGVVVLARAMRTDSRIVWKKGEDGKAHTTSPFLDDLQARMTRR
ncbi:DUF1453 domain-containing protein [Amycolatopsis sp. BJA-103]|uniref:DUF1453 domain-containing protein n=1 Tax=unclassified Amycolatopsis TaxID=2618356 RepID=UPI000C772B6D|nr:DUF1453 domain-containing protein [Amycolatopsis sp. BJA-103]AUI57289.1 DUF1453 domain-containing protein [Amycolatopsis sp. BJA-103]PNE13281.1 DUF1453 domain-containing protein [Amycolatopsis sp. BJA-103]